MPTYTIVQPDYLTRFQCDGQSCDAACCRGWLIRVDRQTYESYRKIRDDAFVRKAARCLRRVENGGDSGYACIQLGGDGRCPFLCPDKLCYIQRNWGETHLSETCRKYPRYLRQIDGAYEFSLNLSCPRAAALALLPDAPFAWQTVTAPALPCAADSALSTETLRASFPMLAHFQRIRAFVLRLLARSDVPAAQRIARLDELARQLDTLAQAGAEAQAPAYLEALESQLFAAPAPSAFAGRLRQQRAIYAAICEKGDASFLAPYAARLADSDEALLDLCRKNQPGCDHFFARHKYLWGNFLASEAFRAGLPFYGAGATFTQRCRLFAALYFSFPQTLFLLHFSAIAPSDPRETFVALASALLRATASDTLIQDLTQQLADTPPLF